MARRITIRLKVHKGSGRLRKVIGMALGRDGQPKKKVWYFDPTDEAAVVNQVMALKARWKTLRATGKVVWDEDPNFLAGRNIGQSIGVKAAVITPITVEKAAELYVAQLERQLRGGQIAEAHFQSQQARLYKAIASLVRLPLSVIGEQQLEAAVLRIAQRPILHLHRPAAKEGNARRRPKKTRQMSAAYANACIHTLKWFFSWCDETELVEWRRPARFKTIFKVKPVLNAEEQQRELDGGREVDYFTLDELTKLWKHASDFQRALILLGLNCGFCSAECADLRFAEVKSIASDRPMIARYRRKTIKTAGRGAYARWHLWQETVTYLLCNRAPANAENLWFLTEDGHCLTDHNAIGQGWKRLTRRAMVRRMGYKFVRKTAAHYIRNVLGYGTEIANMLLAHADSGMVKFYAGRDWDGKLKEATDELREHLKPMFNDETSEPFISSTEGR